jgi:1-acyl-sn-glycerol-3-phosphate acyltransferase
MTTTDDRPAKVGHGLWTTRSRRHEIVTTGMTHLPRSGGAVLALSHFAHQELALVELAVWRHSRRRIRSLVLNGRVEEPGAGGPFRPLRRIFVDLTAGAHAYGSALSELRRGELVALFAEAAGDTPVAVRELRISAARLAMEADVPLLPVVVWCETDSPPDRTARSSAPQRIAIGAPIPAERLEDVRAVTDELRSTMQRMVLELLGLRSPTTGAPLTAQSP